MFSKATGTVRSRLGQKALAGPPQRLEGNLEIPVEVYRLPISIDLFVNGLALKLAFACDGPM